MIKSGKLLPLFNFMRDISFDLKNITLTGLSFGDPSAPKILCLHGWLDNAASFIPLAQHLDDFNLIALDLPGHGCSQHRAPGAHYHLLDNVQDLHELIELNQWQDLIMLGHSMGGIISSLYSACFPEKIKALIAIEAFGGLVKEPQTSAEQLRESVLSRLAAENKTIRHPASLESAVTARLLAGKMKKASAELLMQRNIETREGQLHWRTDPRLRTISSLRLTEEQADAFIAAIQCPWLTILGSEGFEKVKVNMARRQSLVQDFHFSECDGGHHVHMDNPSDVADAILAFL